MSSPRADLRIVDLEGRLLACLAAQDVIAPRIFAIRRLTGGSTHDTWAFDLEHGSDSDRIVCPLVLRRNLAANSLDMAPDAEFALLQWLHDRSIPVARPWLCDMDGAAMSMPFVISERVPGTDLRKWLAAAGGDVDRVALGAGLVRLQARLHSLDLADCPSGIFKPFDVKADVERWTEPLLGFGASSPLFRLATAWLRANVPSADAPCLVHGDFKANNILWTAEGTPAILDWELAHVGDLTEDLAWTMLWTTKDDIVCGTLSPEAYLAAYEAASGKAVDRSRLFFWQLFSLAKLSAIMLTGNGTVTSDGVLGPSHALLSRGVGCLEAAMADYLLATVRERVS